MPVREPAAAAGFARRAGILLAAAGLGWLSLAFWNSVKPLPPGTHVSSLNQRLAESQVDFLDDSAERREILEHELRAIDRAEQLVVLDQCPLAHDLAQRLLTRKRRRPNLKIVLVANPVNEVYGGTFAQYLAVLEQAGIIVARVRVDRLRDSDPLYSSLWRMVFGWWSDPFDELPGQTTLISSLRRRNANADERQLLVADDGRGGWTSIVMSASPPDAAANPPDPAARPAAESGPRAGATIGNVALEVRGGIAHAILTSELQIAAWSTDDDRLPGAPPADAQGVGTIDARFLTEGAIRGALLDAIETANDSTGISLATPAIGDRRLVSALLRAAARGARLQVLLDSAAPGNQAVAAELMRGTGGQVEVRWYAENGARIRSRLALIRHRSDVFVDVGSADLTRRSLGDLNLEANLDLRMPERGAPARAAMLYFSQVWSVAEDYAAHANESTVAYWRYRLREATGLAMF